MKSNIRQYDGHHPEIADGCYIDRLPWSSAR